MYIDTSTISRNGKKYTRYLLRESFREEGKVKHRTIANLSPCSPEEIAAMKIALSHKHNLPDFASSLQHKDKTMTTQQGLSIGALWTLKSIAQDLGYDQALGNTPSGKLALWQVIARVINQGSRLSALRLAQFHAAKDVLDLDSFDENDLYKNLDWITEHQREIEDTLFKLLPQEKVSLFLYDVTSSYLEGEFNELAAYGYNRDGKRGKKQIVIGLLCNAQGIPLTIEVFEGNTQDPQTLTPQINRAAERFGVKEITWVGDRGMIKSTQISQLKEKGFHYITAVTKPQIETLLKKGIFQINLFDESLEEIINEEEGVRYILRKNPIRMEEIQLSRNSKLQKVKKVLDIENQYLQDHPRAKASCALKKGQQKIKQLKIDDWVTVKEEKRILVLEIDEEAKKEQERLDGCYVLKTDLPQASASKEIIHNRYKDLALVENAFRTCKTGHLELRPIYVRKSSRTKGHVFVVMLAYRLIKELSQRWKNIETTVEEGIERLSTLTSLTLTIKGHSFNQIPIPSAPVQELLKAANITLPKVLPTKGIHVATRTKLSKS